MQIEQFNSCQTIEVEDLEAALDKARMIRANGDNKPYKFIIAKSSIRTRLDFDVDKFCFSSLSLATITYDLAAKDLDEKGEELLTWKTATVKVTGNNNLFINISFNNDRGNPSKNGQEVALEVLGTDNVFSNCILTSTQDTLFVGHLPPDLVIRYTGFLPDRERVIPGISKNYFVNCTIEGSIDFVFGTNSVLFYNCKFVSIEDGREGPFYVFAPAHSLEDDIGYVVLNCSFEHKFSPLKKVYLARPWRDYGKVTIIDSSFQEHILEEGWSNWEKTERTHTARFLESPLPSTRVSWAKKHDKEKDSRVETFIKEALTMLESL